MQKSPLLLRATSLLFFAWALVLPAGIRAQSTPRTSGASTPAVRLEFDHDGKGVTGFNLYAIPEGGVPLAFDLGPLKPDQFGQIHADLPPMPPGVYRLEIAAYNPLGEGPRGALPARLVVTRSGASLRKEPAQKADEAPKAPKTEVTRPDTPPRPETTSGKGPLKKAWRILVGSDE